MLPIRPNVWSKWCWESENKIVPRLGGEELGVTQICPPLLLLDCSSFRVLQRPLLTALPPRQFLFTSSVVLNVYTVIYTAVPTSVPSLPLTLGMGSGLCPGLKFGRSNSKSEHASMASALLWHQYFRTHHGTESSPWGRVLCLSPFLPQPERDVWMTKLWMTDEQRWKWAQVVALRL